MQEKAKTADTKAKQETSAKDAPKTPASVSRTKTNHNLVRNGIALVALALIATSLFMDDSSDKSTATPSEAEIQAIKASFKADGTEAREQIEAMQATESPDQPKTAYQQGETFEDKGEKVNAYLMYFYAARQGHNDAAMKLAQMADPLNGDENAEPYQAYKWYKTAADNGIEEAQKSLQKLKEWAETSAKKGNPTAQRLLLQWQS